MNRARRTARKRRNLLLKGAGMDPKTRLGAWALRIWNQGIGYHKRAAIEAAAMQATK